MKNKLSDADAVLLARILTAAAKSGLPFSDAHRDAAIEMLMTGMKRNGIVGVTWSGDTVLEQAINRIIHGMPVSKDAIPPTWYTSECRASTYKYLTRLHETLDAYAPITNETET